MSFTRLLALVALTIFVIGTGASHQEHSHLHERLGAATAGGASPAGGAGAGSGAAAGTQGAQGGAQGAQPGLQSGAGGAAGSPGGNILNPMGSAGGAGSAGGSSPFGAAGTKRIDTIADADEVPNSNEGVVEKRKRSNNAKARAPLAQNNPNSMSVGVPGVLEMNFPKKQQKKRELADPTGLSYTLDGLSQVLKGGGSKRESEQGSDYLKNHKTGIPDALGKLGETLGLDKGKRSDDSSNNPVDTLAKTLGNAGNVGKGSGFTTGGKAGSKRNEESSDVPSGDDSDNINTHRREEAKYIGYDPKGKNHGIISPQKLPIRARGHGNMKMAVRRDENAMQN